ncbi:MAG: phosphate ABC transporter substrate-binding protein [Deltaproteobacteria bacterium]|nr:phosphate ABC transporter substrate-binding protein [Deltaproteobacteria bacterium]
MKIIRFFLLLFLAMLLAGAGPAPAADDALAPFRDEQGTLKIAGGTAHIPVMKAAAREIRRVNPRIRITIAGGGSGVGIKQVGEGLVDIGNSGRRPTAAEIEKYHLRLFKWAVDGVAVVVNPANPVRSLSRAQLRDIYAGRLTNWRQLGWRDLPIDLYTRDQASGTRAVFWKKGLAKGEISPRANFVVANGAMKSAVATDPGAIGYLSVGYLDRTVAPVAIDGAAPSREGRYRISRGLYSNTRGEPRGLTKKFINYLFSPAGQQLIAEAGFIPVAR